METLLMLLKKYLMYISQNYSYAILRPLQEEILARGGEVAWFLEGKEVSPKHLTNNEQQLLSIDSVRAWNPEVVFVPGNVVPSFIPGIKVDVFHGFSVGKLNRRGRPDHFEIRHCFDLYCTQGPDTTIPFQALAEKHKTFAVAETGWSTLDPLFTKSPNNPYLDNSDKRKTIVMCSTFSRNLSCAPIVFEKIKALSETGELRWLIQFHPKMDKAIVDLYKSIQSENLQFIETDNVLPMLQAADVMLCDTSSILIMHLLQRKPVVAFNNTSGNDCLIHIDKVEDIYAALYQALAPSAQLMKKIDDYCNNIHPYNDGKSSARVLQAVEQFSADNYSSLASKPLNFIRKYKLRKKLNYWKW